MAHPAQWPSVHTWYYLLRVKSCEEQSKSKEVAENKRRGFKKQLNEKVILRLSIYFLDMSLKISLKAHISQRVEEAGMNNSQTNSSFIVS